MTREERHKAALVAAGLLALDDSLPLPSKISRGPGGKSSVTHYVLRRGANGEVFHHVVVKDLDDGAEAAREAATLSALPEAVKQVKEFLVIVENTSDTSTGCLVFRDAAGFTQAGTCVDLEEVLTRRRWPEIFSVMDRTLALLERLHKQGSGLASGRPLTAAMSPGVLDPAKLDEARQRTLEALGTVHAGQLTIQLDGLLAESSRGSPLSAFEALPNPFMHEWQLPQYRTSLIHGDLNLSNVILLLQNDGVAGVPVFIDFASSAEAQPTAWDYAKLEAEVSLHVLPRLLAGGSDTNKHKLRVFAEIRSILDGTRKIPLVWYLRRGTKWQFLRLLIRMRCVAAEALKQQIDDYGLLDYLRVLGCYFQRSLAFSNLRTNQLPCAIAMAGAALSAQVDEKPSEYAPFARLGVLRRQFDRRRRQVLVVSIVLLLLIPSASVIAEWQSRSGGPVEIRLLQASIVEDQPNDSLRLIGNSTCETEQITAVPGVRDGLSIMLIVYPRVSDDRIYARIEPTWDPHHAHDAGPPVAGAIHVSEIALPAQAGTYSVHVKLYRKNRFSFLPLDSFDPLHFPSSGRAESYCSVEVAP